MVGIVGNLFNILLVLVLLLNPAYLYVDVNSDTDGDIAMLGF